MPILAAMNSPLVSVVIPAYNADRFLDRCIASVLGQTMPDLECIVVDDGSTDDTPATLGRWSAADPRLRYIRTPNGGEAAARNTGIERAKGEWVQFIDADDLMFPEKLADDFAVVTPLADSTNVVVYSDFEFATEQGGQVVASEKMRFEPTSEAALLDCVVGWRFTDDLPLNADNILYHHTVVQKHTFSDAPMLADHEMFIRMLAAGVRFVHSPGLGVSIRIHGANMTCDERGMGLAYLSLVRWLGASHPDLVHKCYGVDMLLGRALRENDRALLSAVVRTLDVGSIPVEHRNALRLARRAGLLGLVPAGHRIGRFSSRVGRGLRRRVRPTAAGAS